MLKGVNKHVVEVVDMENEYFEKAILFLRPGRPGFDESTLRQRAGEYVRTLKYRPRRSRSLGTRRRKSLSPWKAAGIILGAVLLGILALGAAGSLPL